MTEKFANQFLYPKEYKEQRLEEENNALKAQILEYYKQDDIELRHNRIIIGSFIIDAINIETSVRFEYNNTKDQLIKVIIDFYDYESSNLFEKFKIDNYFDIKLTLFGHNTLLRNMILKKSNIHVQNIGKPTCRMIFKNR